MGTLTIIIGYCGSGKSTLAHRLSKNSTKVYKHDEGFNNNLNVYYNLVLSLLKNNVDCIIVESEYCWKIARDHIISRFKNDLPDVDINWKCFENDKEKADKNMLKTNHKGKLLDHIKINENIAANFTIPEGAEIIPIAEF